MTSPDAYHVSAMEVIAALNSLVAQAKAARIKAFLGTLTPWIGSPFFSEARELVRIEVNQWIRGNRQVDAVIDFEAALQDPDNPRALHPSFDSGDHLHPSPAGYARLAQSIDTKMFEAI